ncbi:protein GVQW3-like [Temnothorax nylanderi]|uniref:protein GVQW3-like n=1 Tax=Temnothorax nylanderi TaxID=102681 RepID=UPI003A857817
MLEEVYGSDCLGNTTVCYWYNLFRNGREDIVNASTAPPKTSRSPENVEKVLEILRSDRFVSTRLIVELTGIPTRTVQRILEKDLGRWKVCASFVLRTLTEDQKDVRVKHCKDMLRTAKLIQIS